MNGQVPPANPIAAASSSLFAVRPDYNSRAVQDALMRLASVDLIELCSEAKVERCRAIRDLRSCGRSVQHVLSACGHSSLCLECCEMAALCPICKTPLSQRGNTLRLRLYNECVEAGLISDLTDYLILEREGNNQLVADVQRLYTLFNVALVNNLASLICHYVIDVCMDETAVSSDPVIAFLLDEVVVKDWCKRTFKIILLEVKNIYSLETTEMKIRMDILLNCYKYLGAISDVIDVLESSFTDSISARLYDLQHLHESVLKTRQHMEIIMWCINHNFLENSIPCLSTVAWNTVVRERKAASVARSWPAPVNQPADSNVRPGSLFIEDALMNIELDHCDESGIEFDLSCLAMDKELFMRSKLGGLLGCYPFTHLRVAADLLFLQGCSTLLLAKQAIFVYYLIDRHWGLEGDNWKRILDDFATTIGIRRHSLVESLVFYLLDDHTDEALNEACALLPEISSISTHPKLAQVLLEREAPDMALMVLRWCGRDGSHMVSLTEAVTAIRVRVECGLLVEAFMYQRNLCAQLKKLTIKGGATDEPVKNNIIREEWVESMVLEICYLCLKRRLIDRIIEFPWNLEEEKYIHKCLLDVAANDPSDTAGNLLVVYYLQRYRYAEAYQVGRKVQKLEEELLSKSNLSEKVVLRIKLASSQRTALVNQSLELLHTVQQQKIKTGEISIEFNDKSSKDAEIPENLNLFSPEDLQTCLLLTPQLPRSSNKPLTNYEVQFQPETFASTEFNPSNKFPSEYGFSSLVPGLHERFYSDMQKDSKPTISSAPTQCVDTANASFLLPIRGTSPIKHSSLHLEQTSSSSDRRQNGYTTKMRNTNLVYSRRVSADPVSQMNSKQKASNDLFQVGYFGLSNKMTASDVEYQGHQLANDQMDIAMRNYETTAVSGVSRWRSDDTSDEDECQDSDKALRTPPLSLRERRSRQFT